MANLVVDELGYYALYLIIVIVILLFIKYWTDIRKDAPEATALMKARHKKMPVIEVSDATGNSFMSVMEVYNRGDPITKGDDFGLQVNPKLLSTQVPDRSHGLPIYHYKTTFHFPLSSNNAKAFHDAIQYVRTNYKHLDFLDDLEVIVLTNTKRDNLLYDSTIVMQSHLEEGMVGEELCDAIKEIQDKLLIHPVQSGFFTYNYAFRLIPTATTSQDLRQLKQYIERIANLEKMGQWANLMVFAICGAIVIIAIFVGFKYAFGK